MTEGTPEGTPEGHGEPMPDRLRKRGPETPPAQEEGSLAAPAQPPAQPGQPGQPGQAGGPGYGAPPNQGAQPLQGAQPGYGAPPSAPFGGAPGYGAPVQPFAQPGSAMGGPPNSEERTWALLGHLGILVVGLIAPLVVYLVKKDESPFCRHHGAQALNFAITQTIYSFVGIILIFVIVGIFMLIAQVIAVFVLVILASIAANRGEYYRYPTFMALPMIT